MVCLMVEKLVHHWDCLRVKKLVWPILMALYSVYDLDRRTVLYSVYDLDRRTVLHSDGQMVHLLVHSMVHHWDWYLLMAQYLDDQMVHSLVHLIVHH